MYFLAGATVDTLTFGADNKGYMASAAAEFYRLRWQLVKAAQSISAYPSLETEGHDLPVCDESEFSTTLAVPGKPSLVKLDIPWANGKKTAYLLRCHFILKRIVLPRQARDKHRESTQKEVRLRTASSKACHRKYDEEYPRFSSAIR